MKVYCGKCVHYTSGYSDREYEHCLAPRDLGMRRIETYLEIREEAICSPPSVRNANNDCRDYKAQEALREAGGGILDNTEAKHDR